ncbi:MAG: hypothetical protein QMC73_06260 [Myxococcota bacterium]|jgi:hypothetical protein
MNSTHDPLVGRHLRVGWWSLLLFLTMGSGLEILHGLKLGFYVDVASDTRRLLWTLAHAHGSLLAMIHIGFATTLSLVPNWSGSRRDNASRNLILSLFLIPGGFFLGGLFIYRGDPGLGIFLLPIGFVFLFLAVWRTAQAISAQGDEQ